MVNNNDVAESTITNTDLKELPEWLSEKLFQQFVEKDFPNFHKIRKFSVKPAVQTGENYMTVMLRVTIEVELKDSTLHSKSYMIKIKPTSLKMQQMIKECKIFIKEHTTYAKYIPAFEEYYRKAGCNIKLAPHLLEPSKSDIKDEFIILEDLKMKGFKNFNRHLGLDLLHTKAVLRKLAQFHAASAQYFDQHGPYPSMYDQCVLSDIDDSSGHNAKIGKLFRDNLQLYGDFQDLEEKLKIYAETPTDINSIWKKNEFNVLNHGDCWTNNIMFQYDNDDQLKETFLIDFQMNRFGSPALDLQYFLLSSTNLEVKLKHFDYFIFYYHQQLTEHLKLINYAGKMPLLKQIHMDLLQQDYWAYITICTMMPVILCESRDDANVDSLMNNDDFKKSMYRNSLYVQSMNILIPWLNNRGAFDV